MDFAISYNLSVANTWFKKRNNNLVTFRARVGATQIDYCLTRIIDRDNYLNCKVTLGERMATQHKLLALNVQLQERAGKEKKAKEKQRIR